MRSVLYLQRVQLTVFTHGGRTVRFTHGGRTVLSVTWSSNARSFTFFVLLHFANKRYLTLFEGMKENKNVTNCMPYLFLIYTNWCIDCELTCFFRYSNKLKCFRVDVFSAKFLLLKPIHADVLLAKPRRLTLLNNETQLY